MTVSSLWKALDRAGCGRPVGARELVDHHGRHKSTNPWNINERQRSNIDNAPVLAVDLSIWICESLTSVGIAENHADPSLQLVYSRTLKLLNLGIRLIGVIEGKRRIQSDDGEPGGFRSRRNGTKFWRACERCEAMFELLGVPVVRAKAEGEALCALLNEEGIADGVISNDGDCLLFGAKVLYTKFSIENLDRSKVMRYDLNNIKACVDDDDDTDRDLRARNDAAGLVELSREDLIVFAIITGSDLAGGGFSQVGCRKAIRFIRKCQLDNPMRKKGAALNELKMWAQASSYCESHCKGQSHCSCCGHPGTKSSHKKIGCQLCGTDPGEECFQLSPGGKFRKSLRAKALTMQPKFNPTWVYDAYLNPNDKQLPLSLRGQTANTLQMKRPKLQELLHSSFIVRGRSFAESRAHIQKTVASLMARTELFSRISEGRRSVMLPKPPRNQNQPDPIRISREIVRDGKACYMVEWRIRGTATDSKGHAIDEIEFSTVEERQMVLKGYPKLIEKYEKEPKISKKQGDAEKQKRQLFLDKLGCVCMDAKETTVPKRAARKRFSFSGHARPKLAIDTDGLDCLALDVPPGGIQRQTRQPESPRNHYRSYGDDVNVLLQYTQTKGAMTSGQSECVRFDSSTIESTSYTDDIDSCTSYDGCVWGTASSSSLTPGHLHFLGKSQGSPATNDIRRRLFDQSQRCPTATRSPGLEGLGMWYEVPRDVPQTNTFSSSRHVRELGSISIMGNGFVVPTKRLEHPSKERLTFSPTVVRDICSSPDLKRSRGSSASLVQSPDQKNNEKGGQLETVPSFWGCQWDSNERCDLRNAPVVDHFGEKVRSVRQDLTRLLQRPDTGEGLYPEGFTPQTFGVDKSHSTDWTTNIDKGNERVDFEHEYLDETDHYWSPAEEPIGSSFNAVNKTANTYDLVETVLSKIQAKENEAQITAECINCLSEWALQGLTSWE